MGKKSKKQKRVNPKKERYSKFHKDKPGALDINFPDLDDEQQKRKRDDDTKVDRFLKFNRNPPPKEIVDRRVKSKR